MNIKQLNIKSLTNLILDISKCYSILGPIIKKFWFHYFGLFILLLLDIAFTLSFSWFIGNLTEAAIHTNIKLMKVFVVIGVIIVSMSILTNYLETILDTVATNVVKNELKQRVLKKIFLMRSKDIYESRSGDLISYFTYDLESIDRLVGMGLISYIRIPILFFSVFIYLVTINWELSLVSLMMGPFAIISSFLIGTLFRNNNRKIRNVEGDLTSFLSEVFQGFSIIRSYTLERIMYNRFKELNGKMMLLELKNAKLYGLFNGGKQLISMFTFLTVLFIGSYFVSQNTLSISSLIIFINLVHHLVSPFTTLANKFASLQKSLIAFEKISELLNQKNESSFLPDYIEPSHTNLKIQFKNVNFSYDQSLQLFKNFNLEISKGKTVAFVGLSGAGKTTLFHLLQGIFPISSGDIQINNKSIYAMPITELRNLFSYVSQDTFIFSGTIRENLLLSKPNITKEELLNATTTANIHEFIMSLPNGYDTKIGERGIKLSGGQKQRLSIARAILRNAPILLLDEATSALDSETEHHVKNALKTLIETKTTLMIAHRLSTIQHADQIIVLENGEIVQIGNHEELLNQSGIYSNLYYLQGYEQKLVF